MNQTDLAYLDAMGIDVWVPRGEEAEDRSGASVAVVLSKQAPPDSDIFCIVENESEADLKLVSDIGRAMRCEPVLAWPRPPAAEGGQTLGLDHALSEQMSTQALIFGAKLARNLLGDKPPHSIAAARIHIVPSVEELSTERDSKRILWQLMREQGIARQR